MMVNLSVIDGHVSVANPAGLLRIESDFGLGLSDDGCRGIDWQIWLLV